VIPAPTSYARASDLDHALELLEEPDAKALAGGQSLVALMKLRIARPALVVDVSDLPLRGVELRGDDLHLGPLTTWDVLASASELRRPAFAAIAECARGIGDFQVRNRGTVGGSIAHADPASDMPAVLLALGARLTLRSSGNERSLALADFLLGRPSAFNQAQPFTPFGHMNYFGSYVQDAWTVSPNLTLNVGLRWDPFFNYENDLDRFNNFSLERFRAGVRSTRFRNAPVGVLYDGDPGLENKSYLPNFAPRLAMAWDPQGNGRMTVRAAWGRFFDLPHMQYFAGFDRLTPFGTQIDVTNALFDDPWANTPGGNPFPLRESPDMVFPPGGGFVTFPEEPKPPYSDQWNVSVQRQLGASWMVSANYLANRGNRLPVGDQLNPAIYSPGATTATTAARRMLVLENPVEGRLYGAIYGIKQVGTSEYDALMFSIQHRGAGGLFLSGNYTMSDCVSDLINYEPGIAGLNLTKPGDVAYDRGSCGTTDQRHVGNMSVVYQIPGSNGGGLGMLTRDWQVSAIVAARSGRHFDVQTGVDNALNGQSGQRPNKVSDDVYVKDGLRWLTPAAFAAPAPGTFGNLERNSLVGPRRFNVDMGVSRSFRFGGKQQMQFRGEVFNLLNRAHYDDPVSSLNSGNFGQIISAGDPRIIQLALKYTF